MEGRDGDPKARERSPWPMALCSTRVAVWLMTLVAGVLLLSAVLPDELSSRYVYGHPAFHLLMGLLAASLVACILVRRRRGLRGGLMLLIHGGALVILAGGLVTLVSAWNGLVVIREGEAAGSCYVTGHPGRQRPLGFSVRLVDFRIERYPASDRLVAARPDGSVVRLRVRAGEEMAIPGTGRRLRVIGGRTGPGLPARPVLEVEAITESGPRGLAVPEGRYVAGPWSPEIRLAYESEPGRIKEFESEVEVIEGGSVVKRHVIRVNSPLKHGGMKLYQQDFDTEEREWTALSVRRDPGALLAYVGFIVLSLGLMGRFYLLPALSGRKDGGASEGGDGGAL